MSTDPTLLIFDPVDPLSFLFDRAVRAVEESTGVLVARVPIELRPAPAPLTDASDPDWAPRWEAALAADAPRLIRPTLIPRSRKAGELVRFADERDMGAQVAAGVMEAFHLEGRDIGRVDVLVEVAVAAGLDMTESKAILDVDRFEAESATATEDFVRSGRGAPSLVQGTRSLEGFHNLPAIRTFLGGR